MTCPIQDMISIAIPMAQYIQYDKDLMIPKSLVRIRLGTSPSDETVYQLSFACERIPRGLREPHNHEPEIEYRPIIMRNARSPGIDINGSPIARDK
jgi:hypothetical protein